MIRSQVHEELLLVIKLCNINNRARQLSSTPEITWKVKSEKNLLWQLEQILNHLSKTKFKGDKEQLLHLENIYSITKWIKKLKKNYKNSNNKRSKLPISLSIIDRVGLTEDSLKWITTLLKIYSIPRNKILNFETIVPQMVKLGKKKLDKLGREDLYEGFNAISNGHSTSAVMILFRVAENLLQKYFEKIKRKKSKKLPWGAMLDVLTQEEKADKTIIGYFTYLNKHRINSVHPYKRYTEDESEKILLHIITLLDEM